jgi:crotonobetainyl-CoA:carnitine CoA-transferase CaiB-like acyl-CoA transferase
VAPAFPFLFDGERPSRDLIAPQLGEQSRAVLARFGLAEAEINALLAAG